MLLSLLSEKKEIILKDAISVLLNNVGKLVSVNKDFRFIYGLSEIKIDDSIYLEIAESAMRKYLKNE